MVLRSAGRWSDVFRLCPPAEAVIGRASSSQIAIRTDQASRRHARISWSDSNWQIEDLGSRNGTFVNGQRIESTQPLSDGDMVEIAGFGIQFTRRIDGAHSERFLPANDSSQGTDDQLTMEMDPGDITDRRRHSRYLNDTLQKPGSLQTGSLQTAGATADNDVSARRLLQLAFNLARLDSVNEAVEVVLDQLAEQIAFETAGAYLVSKPKPKSASESPFSVNDLTLAGTRQKGSRSYRRPPDAW